VRSLPRQAVKRLIYGAAVVASVASVALVGAKGASGVVTVRYAGGIATQAENGTGINGTYLFTEGYATRNQNTLYHYTNPCCNSFSQWKLTYCSGGPIASCTSMLNCTGVSPCVDGRNCSYCYADGYAVHDAIAVQFTLIAQNT
jgi:hypothetical protein